MTARCYENAVCMYETHCVCTRCVPLQCACMKHIVCVHTLYSSQLQVAEVKLPLMTKASSRLLSDPKFKGLREDMAAWRKCVCVRVRVCVQVLFRLLSLPIIGRRVYFYYSHTEQLSHFLKHSSWQSSNNNVHSCTVISLLPPSFLPPGVFNLSFSPTLL